MLHVCTNHPLSIKNKDSCVDIIKNNIFFFYNNNNNNLHHPQSRLDLVEHGALTAISHELLDPSAADMWSKCANAIGALAANPIVASAVAHYLYAADTDDTGDADDGDITAGIDGRQCTRVVAKLIDMAQSSDRFLSADGSFALGWLVPHLPAPWLAQAMKVMRQASHNVVTSLSAYQHHHNEGLDDKAAAETETWENQLTFTLVLLVRLLERFVAVFKDDEVPAVASKKARKRRNKKMRAKLAAMPQAMATSAASTTTDTLQPECVSPLLAVSFLEALLSACSSLSALADPSLLRLVLQVLSAIGCFKAGRLALMRCASVAPLHALRSHRDQDVRDTAGSVTEALIAEAMEQLAMPSV